MSGLALVVSLVSPSVAQAPPSALLDPAEQEWLAARGGVIVVGPEANYPPFVFSRGGAPPAGISIDYLKRIEAKLGLTFTYAAPAELSALLARARAGEVDVLTSLKPTPAREEFLAFTDPYVAVPAVIIARRGATTERLTLEELRGRRVAVGAGYGVQGYLEQLGLGSALVPVPDDLAGLRRVSFGEVDAAVVDVASASFFLTEEGIGNLRVAGDTGFVYDLSLAVRKDAPLLRSILAKGLARVTEEERQEITHAWIPLLGREGALQERLRWGLGGLAALAVGLLLAVAWNRSLRRRVDDRTAELRRQTAESQALTQAIPDPLLRIRRDGTVVAFSPSGRGLLGASAGEVVGKRLGELPLSPEFQRAARAQLDEVLEARALREYTLQVARPEGPCDLDVRVVPASEDEALWILRDVTAQRQAVRRQRELDEQALHAQKLESLGVLAGGIAHDFNNLLTAIAGNVELTLEQLPPASPGRVRLDRALEASTRAAQICRLLLAYAGRERFEVKPVDPCAFVRDAVALLEVSISKSASLRLDLAADAPWVSADAGQLQQVVMNLVMNASEAIGERPGTIVVAVARAEPVEAEGLPPVAGGYVALRVSDSGSGMTEEVMARVFDPFFTTKFTGRGLGLAAVQGIVRAHGGAVRLQSAPGAGTTFTVLLPALTSPAAPAPSAVDAPPRAAGTVLVVEDEPAVRELTRIMLERAGLEVLEASGGAEALALFRAHARVGCVVLDVVMPDLNGAKVFEALQEVRRVPVLFVSGYAEEDLMGRLTDRQGFAGFLSKPYKQKELVDRVLAMLAGRGDQAAREVAAR